MATIEIQGKSYEFPIGTKERKDDVYYLKKALNGDKEAGEIFLQGKKERMFYIGKDSPLWVKVYSENSKIHAVIF